MYRIIIILSLIIGGYALAKDGNFKPKSPNAPIDQDEEFFNSPMGQDVTRLFEEFTTGKKSYDQTREEFNKKWGADLDGGAGAPTPQQVPNAPLTRIK